MPSSTILMFLLPGFERLVGWMMVGSALLGRLLPAHLGTHAFHQRNLNLLFKILSKDMILSVPEYVRFKVSSHTLLVVVNGPGSVTRIRIKYEFYKHLRARKGKRGISVAKFPVQ